jgi:hypothetical protein
VFVRYAAICHYRRFVRVSGAPVRVRSAHVCGRMSLLSVCTCVWSSCLGEICRSHPDRSSRHTYKPRVMTYGRIHLQISPRQELQTHIQTDGNDIRPHTAQTHNESTSTESNLVTAQSTAHEPPEDGGTYGPKHERATSLKCF